LDLFLQHVFALVIPLLIGKLLQLGSIYRFAPAMCAIYEPCLWAPSISN